MSRKKILIADDSPTVIKMLTFMLASLPCDVITATDGVEAIKLSYSTHPDLLLLDILMPKMNGYQVCRLLKDDPATKHIPIVMLTAKDQQSDRFWGMATGANDYLTKDFEDSLLLDTVTRILKQDIPHSNLVSEREVKEITTVDVLSHANNLLDRQLYQSTITNRINQLASSIQNLEETLASVFELLSRILTFQIGAISLAGMHTAQIRLFFYIAKTVSSHVFEQTQHVLLKEFSRTLSAKEIVTSILRGEVCAEDDGELRSVCESVLIGKNTKIGAMVLGDSRKGRFSEEDRETFRIVGKEAAVVLDNARLYDANARIYRELEQELRKAYDIQKLMLPQSNPMAARINIESMSIPAKEVGGDYYDYFPLDDDQLLLAIGDVTGKGVPAALMMATVKTALQIRLETTHDVRELMNSLNNLVFTQATKQYMTLFLGVIDVRARTITYCNAGHNFPYIISPHEKTLRYLEEGALPLGFIQDHAYLAYTHTFRADEIFFFYTDGVVEVTNVDGELFGYPRLEKLLLTHCQNDLATIHLKILEQIEDFCHETPQDDDMTIILGQIKPDDFAR